MLTEIRDRLWRTLIEPRLGARGYRPSKWVPLDDAQLRAKFGYDEEDEIKRAIQRVKDHTMTSFEQLASLWQQVRYADRYRLDGNFVECGVWRGGCVGMMALAHLRSSTPPARHLHLFDSFEGLPEPKAEADGKMAVEYAKDRAGGKLVSIGECVGTLEENRALLEQRLGYPRSLLHYHRGWFQHSVPERAPELGPIALLRLDGDWYESTKVCLEHLYPKVVKGGVVVIDDYGYWEGCRTAVDEFIQKQKDPILLSHVDFTCRYWIKPS